MHNRILTGGVLGVFGLLLVGVCFWPNRLSEDRTERLDRLLAELSYESDDPEDQALVRTAAKQELGRVGGEAIPGLLRILRDGPTDGHRLRAYEVLGGQAAGLRPFLPEILDLARDRRAGVMNIGCTLAWKVDPNLARSRGLPADTEPIDAYRDRVRAGQP